MRKYLIIAILLFMSSVCWGQGRVYTKGVRLQDFVSKTTKIVIDGDDNLQTALVSEANSYWRVSNFEFCTAEEYNRLIGDRNYYFLNVQKRKGTNWLVLTKGGATKSDNYMEKRLEVVAIPFDNTYECLGAYMDIIQTYAKDAGMSEHIAYQGLRHYCRANRAQFRKTIKFYPQNIEAILAGKYTVCYDGSTHDLYKIMR